jgi:hypothetical protein
MLGTGGRRGDHGGLSRAAQATMVHLLAGKGGGGCHLQTLA